MMSQRSAILQVRWKTLVSVVLTAMAVLCFSCCCHTGEAATKADVARVHTDWPFTKKEAVRRQAETAKALGVPVERAVDLPGKQKLLLRLIPAGEFMMGSPGNEAERDDDEGPVHRVRITRPFYVAKYEVTVGQFRQFVVTTKYKQKPDPSGAPYVFTGKKWERKADASWQNPYLKQDDKHPVVCVSWEDARQFCAWLNKIEKERPKDLEYRLPSEAEWEYACRAGSDRPFSFGDTVSTAKANYNDVHPRHTVNKDKYRGSTTPVSIFPSNAWGVYDMHGNAGEWCEDRHHKSWYEDSPLNDPLCVRRGCPDCGGHARITRGASWKSPRRFLRCADRNRASPREFLSIFGFRVVLGPPIGTLKTHQQQGRRE